MPNTVATREPHICLAVYVHVRRAHSRISNVFGEGMLASGPRDHGEIIHDIVFSL
jgi:hypothetical protein